MTTDPNAGRSGAHTALHEREYEGTELALFAHAHHWKAYWTSVIAPYIGDRVLDVGAGLGATADALKHVPCSHWTALEPDPSLTASIAAGVHEGRLPDRVEARLGTLADVAEDESFDSILYIDVLEHIEDDRREVERASHHLRPGGNLVVLAPAHPWLYTPFDRAIGHHRRYTRASLRALRPPGMHVERLHYLDSVGMLASLGNRMLLRSSQPTLGQIRIWDNWMVPLSRVIDRWFLGHLGKSIVGVFRRIDPVIANAARS